MKPFDIKLQFINLRAEGKSLRKIAEELSLAKSTCQRWAVELDHEITLLKQEKLDTLYKAYGMSKEARIKELGETLSRINEALEGVYLENVEPDKLLRLKLQYMQEQGKLYAPAQPEALLKGASPEEILQAYINLYNRVAAGEIGEEQANRESAMLLNMARLYEAQKLPAQINLLREALSK